MKRVNKGVWQATYSPWGQKESDTSERLTHEDGEGLPLFIPLSDPPPLLFRLPSLSPWKSLVAHPRPFRGDKVAYDKLGAKNVLEHNSILEKAHRIRAWAKHMYRREAKLTCLVSNLELLIVAFWFPLNPKHGNMSPAWPALKSLSLPSVTSILAADCLLHSHLCLRWQVSR